MGPAYKGSMYTLKAGQVAVFDTAADPDQALEIHRCGCSHGTSRKAKGRVLVQDAVEVEECQETGYGVRMLTELATRMAE